MCLNCLVPSNIRDPVVKMMMMMIMMAMITEVELSRINREKRVG